MRRRCRSPLGTAVFVICRILLHIAAFLEKFGTCGADVGLPGRGADMSRPGRIGEEFLDLFERLPRRLGEHEEDVDEHGGTEATENHICPPLNVDERRRHKVTEREVEGPIGRCGERHGLATDPEGVQLRWIDPADWTPGGGVGRNEEVRAGYDRLGSGPGDGIGGFRDPVDSLWARVRSTRGQKTADGKLPGHHQYRSDKKRGTPAPAVDEEERRYRHDHVDDEING